MKRRAQGSGSVYQLKSGRWIARVKLPDGQRATLGTYTTKEEADEVVAAAIVVASEHKLQLVGGVTLASWFPHWLDHLERSRAYVAMPTARSIWRTWLFNAPFAEAPLRSLTARSIEAWLEKLARVPSSELSDSYIGQMLQLLRKSLESARKEGIVEKNVALGIFVPRRPAPTTEPWTYLTIEEQQRVLECEAIPEEYRCMMAFAIGTGLRAREQFCLLLSDVHLGQNPHVFVRFGALGRAPKGRRLRRVPLLPHVVALIHQWLSLLPEWCRKNERGLLFPGRQGGVLDSDRFASQDHGKPGMLSTWLRSAGVTRRVRWHDLRHTCAASLISGSWGRGWRMEEVREFLGHASIDETQRYAHLAPEALHKAAAETVPTPSQFGGLSLGNGSGLGTPPSLTPETENKQQVRVVEETRWLVVGLAERVVRAIADGGYSAELLHEFADLVLASDERSRLAVAVKAGGAHVVDRALDLARIVLDERHALEKRSAS